MSSKWIVLLVVGVGVAGCRGESGVALGRVGGRVTFYGVPARAEMLFQPVDERDVPTGRASTAFAAATGRYEALFTESETGAQVGRHLVTIKVYADPELAAALDRPEAATPVRITRVVRHVTDGRNTFDFALTY